ncbi:MAG: ankyrin repeat domain-containing protein, partial [Bacteroidota bacterium]
APNISCFGATFMGNVKVVKQHIKAGTDLNMKDQYGSTPLMIATTFGKAEIAKALFEGGADLHVTSADGSTALHTAAFLCRTEIVEELLKNGANKDLVNNYGSTPLASISGPFGDIKPIYDQLSKDLGPFGFKLDYDQIESTRPKIAKLLSQVN